MISTSLSSTSDYYSNSDLEYDGDEDVVKAAPHHSSSTKETHLILETLLHHRCHQPSSYVSSRIKVQQSISLLKV